MGAKRHSESVPKPKGPRRSAPTSKRIAAADLDPVDPALTDLDRQVLMLADEVKGRAESARNLILRAGTQAHVARFGSVDAHKRLERARMERMALAWLGLDVESSRDARMFLTEGILFYAHVRRRDTAPNDGAHRRHAVELAQRIALYFPAFAAKMSEPDRIERIRAAIAASAAMSAKRRPWKLIAATWEGRAASRELDQEGWRVEFSRYRSRYRKRPP
jgi:hypothetical protein